MAYHERYGPHSRGLCPIETLEDRTLFSVSSLPEYRGVNALDVFNPASSVSDNASWGLNIIREGVFDFDQAVVGYGYNATYNLHGLQAIADQNTAAGVVTIFCPFSWNGAEIRNSTPSQTTFWASYNTRLGLLAQQFTGQDKVWLEVWNEPYAWNKSTSATTWLSDMTSMVMSIRNAGANNTILIPGGQNASSENVILAKGQALIDADPQHRVVFDLHAYNTWFDSGQAGMEQRMQTLIDANLPFIFGEFGAGTPAGTYNVAPFLQAAADKRISALAWSWNYGDGSALMQNGVLNDTPANFNYATQVKRYLASTPTLLPVGWFDSDIGSPGVGGTAIYSSDTYSVTGGGSDIWNSSDQFNYAATTATGNCAMTARVTSQGNTDYWAKAGLMFRASTDPAAPFVAIELTPGGGLHLQTRTTAGASAIDVSSAAAAASVWIRLVNHNATVTAYYSPIASPSSPGDWQLFGAVNNVTFTTQSFLAGLAVTSHNNSTASTASFSSVALTQAPQLASVVVQDGTPQRSVIKTLTVAFTTPVVLSSGSVTVLRRNGSSVPFDLSNPSGDGRAWLMSFTGPLLNYGSLADGSYRLTISAVSIHDAAGNALDSNAIYHFYRLFGDINGDRQVTSADLVQMRLCLTTQASYVTYFDYDGDGLITRSDYLQARNRALRVPLR